MSAISSDPGAVAVMAGGLVGIRRSARWQEAVNRAAPGVDDIVDVNEALACGPGLQRSVIGSHEARHPDGGPDRMGHSPVHPGKSRVQRRQGLRAPGPAVLGATF